MITGYISYFENLISNYIEDDLTIAVYDEFNYDDSSDVKFTVIRLAGNIDSGIVRIPYQIICEVDSKYVDEIRTILDNFAIANNETVITLDGENVKQLYSTSYKITNFQQNGLVDKTTFGVNANLVTFGPVDIDAFVVNNDTTIEVQHFAFNYNATPSSVGSRPNNNGKLKELNRDVALSYAITFVPKDTTVQKDITKQAIFGITINKQYSITITTCGLTNTITCILSGANVTKDKNGVMVVNATFTEGDF